MLFNSIDFAIFLPIVFLLYWFVAGKSVRLQNILILVASYYFYGCWDTRFLFLLIFSTVLDYYTGIKISSSENSTSKKFWFWLSITINLGFLAVFKYYNFFVESFSEALTSAGFQSNLSTLEVILPVGISFYTFHGLSYVIDIYKDRIKPERNFVTYSLFVSFFPLLVAGPIERATHLLPQLRIKRNFDYKQSVDGLRQILWGFFKKVVIADQCAVYVNQIFGNYSDYSGTDLALGAVLFAFQIYCDFSGYSDIALGTAKLFGIDLLRNFSYPYFSRSIAEFWRRWHISLSTWFRDYLYIPLGGSKGGQWLKIRNILIIFVVSGFWHGANWTFIIWGLLHAIYIMPSVIFKTNRNNLDIVAEGSILPSIKEIFQMALTFFLAVIAWIFFRAESVAIAFDYIRRIFTGPIVLPTFRPSDLLILTIIFFAAEWLGRERRHPLQNLETLLPRPLRWLTYYLIVFAILSYIGKEQAFIYFQF